MRVIECPENQSSHQVSRIRELTHLESNSEMEYKLRVNEPISAEQFIDILERSTLAQRRPIDDYDCIKGMVENSNLVVTAWDDEKLVGIARSMTDFHYACYLSDLAVDKEYQKIGIGKALLITTQNQLGPKCKLILIAAPSANEYYGHLGFEKNPRCWVFDGGQEISN